jgi:hypothetical protein
MTLRSLMLHVVGWLALATWLYGCGSVSAVDVDGAPDAQQGAAGAAGSAAGADGQAGTSGAAGASGGAAGSAAAGTAGTAGAGGTGAAGAPGGVSVAACPVDWAVQRGCSANVQGAPCDVCHDAAGAPLRCATSAVATARVFCVPDCASCY